MINLHQSFRPYPTAYEGNGAEASRLKAKHLISRNPLRSSRLRSIGGANINLLSEEAAKRPMAKAWEVWLIHFIIEK